MTSVVAMFAALDPKLSWYVARAAGIVAWLLCAAAVLWGLFLSTKLVRRRGLPAWLLDLHTFLGTLALVFTAIHVAGLVADNYVDFGWKEVLVPMASDWKPGPVAWGIAATYLLIAVQTTSWLRKRLPRKLWHAIHLSSLLMFVAGTVHGIQAGTDWSNRVVRWGALVICALVTLMCGSRFLRPPRPATQRVPDREPLAATTPTAG